MKKSQKFFLYIAISVFMGLILIYTVNYIIFLNKEFQYLVETGKMNELPRGTDLYYIFVFAVYLGWMIFAGISLIKNGYVFLGERSIIRKILCVISSALVIISAILWFGFQHYDPLAYSCLWAIIISFILSSLKFKKDGCDMNKSQKLFLYIGISVAVILFIIRVGVFFDTLKVFKHLKVGEIIYPGTSLKYWRFFTCPFYMSRMIFSAICLVKNGYVFLGEQSKIRKILCLISSVMVIIPYIFMYDYQQYYSFVVCWLAIIIAFILGSLRFGKRGTNIIKEDE